MAHGAKSRAQSAKGSPPDRADWSGFPHAAMISQINVGHSEVEDGTLSSDHLEEAVASLRRDGAVVLNDVIDPAHVAALRERMLADLPRILARADAPFNFNRGNVQQDPPPFPCSAPESRTVITAATPRCRAAPSSRRIPTWGSSGLISSTPLRRLPSLSTYRSWT
jgi:hypothetical protein